MVSTTTIIEMVIMYLEPRTITKVTERPMHQSLELSRKNLAQISASIKTTHVALPKGSR